MTDAGWKLSGEAALHRSGGKIERMPGHGQSWRPWRCCRCKSVSPKPDPDDLAEFTARPARSVRNRSKESNVKDKRTDPYPCSFCGKTLREVAKMIAGPMVFICDECVELCAEIMAGDEGPVASGKLKVLGEHTSTLAKLIAERDTAVKAAADAERFGVALRKIGTVVASTIGVLPLCMWCGANLATKDEAREHVATCEKHPAVMRLRAIEAAP